MTTLTTPILIPTPEFLKPIFHGLSTEFRIKLFNLVASSLTPLKVGEIAGILQVRDSSASHNLKILETCGLLSGFVGGTYKLYTINHEMWRVVQNYINNIQQTTQGVSTNETK